MAKLFIFLILCINTQVFGCNIYTNKYDLLIKESAETYLDVHWHYLKAQLAAESGFCEDVITGKRVSSVGAIGIGQFMPATWKDVARQMSFDKGVSPKIANYAIKAAGFYMRQLKNAWGLCFKNLGCRTLEERHLFAVAGYNAGNGNIQKANKLAKGSIRLTDTLANLYKVTGIHHKETLSYVKRVEDYKIKYDLSK